MMGQIFEVTGAKKRMAYTFLKLFGKKRKRKPGADRIPCIYSDFL